MFDKEATSYNGIFETFRLASKFYRLPQKNGTVKLLYYYEGIIFDSLVTQDGNDDSSNNKHLRIKKCI
jgi:hypothetical protein